MKLYKYIPIQYAFDDIKNNGVKISSPSEFDDNNDCKIIIEPSDYNECCELLYNYMYFACLLREVNCSCGSEYVSGFKNIKTKHVIDALKQILSTKIYTWSKEADMYRCQIDKQLGFPLVVKSEIQEQMKNLLNKAFDKHVLCLVASFSNSYKNSWLWNKYANNYDGICMFIEIPKTNIYRVHYKNITSTICVKGFVEKVIGAKFFDNTEPDYKEQYNSVKKILTHKSVAYHKEVEYRYVNTNEASKGSIIQVKDINYLQVKNFLKVYIGETVNSKNRRDLIKLLKEKNIDFDIMYEHDCFEAI